MFFRKKAEGPEGRLTGANLQEYLIANYGAAGTATARKNISMFSPLLQSDFGGAMDCTLTSITAIASFREKYQRTHKEIYAAVEATAKNYAYSPDNYGTISIFINNIIDKTFNVKSKKKYLKGVGYTWKYLKNTIDAGTPMILSMSHDGRDYYTNHSVCVIGYDVLCANCHREFHYLNQETGIDYETWASSL